MFQDVPPSGPSFGTVTLETQDLIDTLVERHRPVRSSWIEWASMTTVIVSIGVAVAAIALTIGFRTDLTQAFASGTIVAKYAFMLTMLVLSGHLFGRLSRPGHRLSDEAIVFSLPLAFILMAAVVQFTLYGVPNRATVLGEKANWILCVALVPLLAIVPFAALVYVLRRSAPTDLAGAGIATGLFSTAIAATVYAAHCPCDTPVFVAIWYPLAFAVGGLIGRVLVPRLVRW
jgi:hypothetical protein